MRNRIKVNSATIQSYLDGGNGVEAILEQKAQEVLARAQEIAPVKTGEYRDSLHIVTDHTDRMVKRVTSDARHRFIIEAEFGVLAKALG